MNKEPYYQQFLLAQYVALREEIARRMEWQHQLIALAIAATGAIISLGTPTLILASPILLMFITTLWVHYARRVEQIGTFIGEAAEKPFLIEESETKGWESRSRKPKGSKSQEKKGWFTSLERNAALGILVGAEIAITVVALFKTSWSSENLAFNITFLIIDVFTIIATAILILMKSPARPASGGAGYPI